MQEFVLTPAMIIFLVTTSIEMAVPLILAAIGGMFSEKGGVVNIAIEGLMLIGAFTAVLVTYLTGNVWLGLLGAIASGGLLAVAHAVICVKFKGDHIISGTGIILFATGFTTLMLQVVWDQRGVSDTLSNEAVRPMHRIEFLQGIPILENFSPMVFMMVAIVIISYFVLFKTPFGLRLRAAGEDPSTLDTAGVNVEWIRAIGVIISGCLAGMAGAYLSIAIGQSFGKVMTGGKGFIALAAMIFGNWNPIGCLLAGLLFGFLEGLQISIGLWFQELLPWNNFIKMIPYALTVIALAGIRKSVPPKDIANPYEKEGKG